ncbi:HAD-like domain-containing protein [Mycena sp. CBHHK59/15]|nr:HAD-like domain-containing protein [Mycena sp. CBHHK59/15]
MQVSSSTRPAMRGVLIDISGTLHVGSTRIPRAAAALRRLQASGIPYHLCSNTSKESTRAVVARLQELGFDVGVGGSAGGAAREVWTSIGSVRRALDDMGLRRPYLILSDSAREDIRLSPSHSEEDDYGTPYDSVVIGLCPARLDYAHLNTAFRILVREHPACSPEQPVLIAAHTARYFEAPAGDGLALGPGPFVTALEHAARVKAHVVGKPARAFFEAVVRDIDMHGCIGGGVTCTMPADGRIAIIGDDVSADLCGGALELGLWRVLVRTGKYRPGDESRPDADGGAPPDEVCASFADFVDRLLGVE